MSICLKVDSPLYEELNQLDAQLDAILTNKKRRINDALLEPSPINGLMRVFIYNTHRNQIVDPMAVRFAPLVGDTAWPNKKMRLSVVAGVRAPIVDAADRGRALAA